MLEDIYSGNRAERLYYGPCQVGLMRRYLGVVVWMEEENIVAVVVMAIVGFLCSAVLFGQTLTAGVAEVKSKRSVPMSVRRRNGQNRTPIVPDNHGRLYRGFWG